MESEQEINADPKGRAGVLKDKLQNNIHDFRRRARRSERRAFRAKILMAITGALTTLVLG